MRNVYVAFSLLIFANVAAVAGGSALIWAFAS